jgi:hypothetical protein
MLAADNRLVGIVVEVEQMLGLDQPRLAMTVRSIKATQSSGALLAGLQVSDTLGPFLPLLANRVIFWRRTFLASGAKRTSSGEADRPNLRK